MKRFIYGLILLALAASPAGSGSMTLLGAGKASGGGGGSSVAVNATGTAVVVTSSVTSATFNNLTIVAGSNTALIAVISFDTGGIPSGATATWDSGGTNQAMTLLASSSAAGGGVAVIFGLRNPIIGNKTLALAWTTADVAYVNAMAFNNVSQTSDATAFPVAGRITNSATSNQTTITIPSNANDYCVSVNNIPAHRTTQSDTELFYSTAGVTNNGEAQYGVGTASKTMTVSLDASSSWSTAGVDVAVFP